MNNVLEYIFGKLQHSDVNVICDRYYEYSINSSTRTSRTVQASRRHSLTPSTPLPAQNVVLAVTENKQQIIDTICEQLREKGKTHEPTMKHKPSPNWTSFNTSGNLQMGCHREKELETTHEEADVIIPRQGVDATTQGSTRIKVICDDTDVFILLVHYYQQCSLTFIVLRESTSRMRAVIDIGATVKQHADITGQLLAAHALTGCDTVAFMWGIGKAKAVKVLLPGCKLLQMGNTEMPMDEVLLEATQFVARCYGCASRESMSATRYEVWIGTVTKIAGYVRVRILMNR